LTASTRNARCSAVKIAQLEEFCEIVRLAAPDQSDEDIATEQTRDIRETYRETVMDTPGFEDMYHETLEEHLRKELSPASATAFLSKRPFTGCLKRALLVATSDAIQRRERFEHRLATEAESLETALEELMRSD